MNPAWLSALWWRYRWVNPALMRLPCSLQYALAEAWGRVQGRLLFAARDWAVGLAGLLGSAGTPWGETVARFCGLQSRIRLDDHRMACAPHEDVMAQVTLHGADRITQRLSWGRGVIILTAHYGRLGMIGPALRKAGLKSSFLSATVDERAVHLTPLQRWIGYRNGQSLQKFAGGAWIMADDPATRLRAVLRRGEPLIVVADAFSSSSPRRERFRFGPGELSVPSGVVRLARATGSPLVLALMLDAGLDRVELRCWDLPDDPWSAVQSAFDELARHVQAQPWQWWLLPQAATIWQPMTGQAGAMSREG